MGEQQGVAAVAQRAQQRVEVPRERPVRGLDEQRRARAGERHAAQVVVVELERRRHVDLAARQDLDVEPVAGGRRVELGDALGELARDHARMVAADVRRGHHRPRPLADGDLEHADRSGEVRGTVVDPRQDVRVQIDHLVPRDSTTEA
jgi:hypothetical protein